MVAGNRDGYRRRGALEARALAARRTYDDVPSYVVSMTEFRDGLVTHETQYVAAPFASGASRAQLVERIDDKMP